MRGRNNMRNPAITRTGLTLIISVLIMTSSLALGKIESNSIGTWNYEAPDAEYGYRKGTIVIAEIDDKLEGVVNVNGQEINMNDIKEDKNVLSFSLFVEGDHVSVELVLEEDKIEGFADTSDGKIEVTGVRI